MDVCKICSNAEGNTPYSVREMQLGLRDRFRYFQCGVCGCLQIAAIPYDMRKYYPATYFSFRDYSRLAHAQLRAKLDKWRVKHALGKGLPSWLSRLVKPLDYISWLKTAGLGVDAKILDVGCGSGKLLLRMKLGGLGHCEGADPYLENQIRYPNGLIIHKSDFRNLQKQWDFIMFHHSFEHMADPFAVLGAAAKQLTTNGAILIRVPLADSVAWERYRENWYNLDAPRHFFLHTEISIQKLAEQSGLEVFHHFRDATAAQFSMSELYARDVAGNAGVKPETLIDRGTLNRFRHESKLYNREGRGDCGGFFLHRRAPTTPALPPSTPAA